MSVIDNEYPLSGREAFTGASYCSYSADASVCDFATKKCSDSYGNIHVRHNASCECARA